MRFSYYCLLFLIVLFGLIPAYAQDLYSCIAVGTIPDGSGRLSYISSYNYETPQSASDAVLTACNQAGLINSKIAMWVRNGACAVVFFGNGGYAATWGDNIIDAVEGAKRLAVDQYGGQPGTIAKVAWVIASSTPDQYGNFFGSYSDVLPNRRILSFHPDVPGSGFAHTLLPWGESLGSGFAKTLVSGNNS